MARITFSNLKNPPPPVRSVRGFCGVCESEQARTQTYVTTAGQGRIVICDECVKPGHDLHLARLRAEYRASKRVDGKADFDARVRRWCELDGLSTPTPFELTQRAELLAYRVWSMAEIEAAAAEAVAGARQ